MEELLKAVGNFGFPIVVSAYLLIRLENRLDRVASAISELAVAVSVLRENSEGPHNAATYSSQFSGEGKGRRPGSL